MAQSAYGLNPLLRHFGMIIHPPMLYRGFTGFVIAFALSALASGDLSTNWSRTCANSAHNGNKQGRSALHPTTGNEVMKRFPQGTVLTE